MTISFLLIRNGVDLLCTVILLLALRHLEDFGEVDVRVSISDLLILSKPFQYLLLSGKSWMKRLRDPIFAICKKIYIGARFRNPF